MPVIKKRFLAPGLLFATAAALLNTTACSTTGDAHANQTPDVPTVAVARVTPHDLSRQVVLTAEFRPYQEVDVMSKVAGYVKKMYVDVGDRVKAGQLLATLEVPEMTDDIVRAAAATDRSSAEVRRAEEELQRAESGHQITHLQYTRLAAVMKDRPGLVAQQEVDDAQGKDLVAEAQIQAAKSALDAAKEQVRVSQAEHAKLKTMFGYTSVTAPFNGVITKRFADNGSMIQAGISSQTQAMPVARLSQNDLLRLVLPVPESAVPKIRLGSTVQVRVPSLNRTFPGRVARFSDRVDMQTRTMETEVDVPNPSLVLVPGMYAEATLLLEKRDDVLTIPLTALAGTNEAPLAYVVDPQNRIAIRHIAVGLQTADRAEVVSGANTGDLVVIGNRAQLKEGETVRPKLTELAAVHD